jgi:hypothetical protein
MTAPATPTPPPPSDAGKFLAAAEGIIKREGEKHWLLLLIIAMLVALLAWTMIGFVTRIESGHAKDAVIAAKAHAMAVLDSSDKAHAARAKFWQSEALQQRTAVARDTQLVFKSIDGAPRYAFTPTGMQIIQPDSAPPAPALDTTSPGHKFGAAVPYAVQPNTTFYTRTADFDSLAARSLRTQRDQQAEITDDEGAIADLNVVIVDRTAERDTARTDLAAEKKAEGKKIRAAAIKSGAVGAAVVLVVRALLH